ncbi:MAG: sulfurtransferase [Candidatus Cloacimonetes bacterium]|nr:sulfurtransferase [Candidatus Cloacimonadota bacterium]
MKLNDKVPFGNGKVKWVSTEWLNNNLDNDQIQIIDCQPNVHDYIQEHIPNARYMNENLLRIPEAGIPGKYISEETFKLLAGRLGLNIDKPVVVYSGKGAFKGWGDGLEQTMIAYSLARFGQIEVFLLSGGLQKWKSENRILTKKFSQIQSTIYPATIAEDYFLTYEEFKEVKDNQDTILLDARPSEIYEGQGPWIKAGHIPGALNLPWKDLMTDENPTLRKSYDKISAILDKMGISPDKMIICSCGTGREATNEFIMFKWLLNYPNVKIYEGSFTEWTAYEENPTVTGKSPR